jgi:hypothetical protein
MTKSKNITARPCEAEVWVRALCAAISTNKNADYCLELANEVVYEYSKAVFSDEDEA